MIKALFNPLLIVACIFLLSCTASRKEFRTGYNNLRISQCLDTSARHGELKAGRVPTSFHSFARDGITIIKMPILPPRIREFEEVVKRVPQPLGNSRKGTERGEPGRAPADMAEDDPPSIPLYGYLSLGLIFTAFALTTMLKGWAGWFVVFSCAVLALVFSRVTLNLIVNDRDKYTGEWLAYVDMAISIIEIILLLALGVIGLMFGDP